MLPLTLALEEFNGREKISYLPRRLDTAGSGGSDPKDGDLIYFVPWGNLGFYYNAEASDLPMTSSGWAPTRQASTNSRSSKVTV